ncbi:hypothetical protein ACH41E_33465 [Streptomyces sp. NPDC020412]|uniref:hypothetical protein n=1 Tax=Streptomyces sp. NPDC020412 TaxID=3365073 RepID=UPI0037BD3DDA
MTGTPYHLKALLTPGGLWRARVDEVPELHEEHRSLAQLERRVLRAVSISRGVAPSTMQLAVSISTGNDEFDQALTDARETRARADELARQARTAAAPLAQRLIRAGVSHRDAGRLLGTSGALVSSMVNPKP